MSTSNMKAIGYIKNGPVDEVPGLEDIEIDTPVPGARDLLVDVHAISVNPVDTKVRMRAAADTGHKVLGWDVSGVVRAAGAEVEHFKAGDEVFYAGALDRPGANSEQHVVDERLVGRKPGSLTHAEAAAMPLTSITAWELLFDRFGVKEGGGDGQTLLIIGGAGGVGSMMIQLARKFTRLTIVATASRPETISWCEKMGAHHVVDHRQDLEASLEALGLTAHYVASLTATEQHFPAIAELIAPQGKFGLIDDPDPSAIDIALLKRKSISLHWEFMYTRSMFQTDDMSVQSELLNRVSAAVDAGELISTANQSMGRINAENLRKAHRFVETGSAIGKTVLEGF